MVLSHRNSEFRIFSIITLIIPYMYLERLYINSISHNVKAAADANDSVLPVAALGGLCTSYRIFFSTPFALIPQIQLHLIIDLFSYTSPNVQLPQAETSSLSHLKTL